MGRLELPASSSQSWRAARVGAEDEKLGSGRDPASGGAGCITGAERADGLTLDGSIADKRRRSAGSAERLSKDEKSACAGAVQGHPLSRPAPYLRHDRPGARHGRENPVRHHRPHLIGYDD